jgi:hypothetical protein
MSGKKQLSIYCKHSTPSHEFIHPDNQASWIFAALPYYIVFNYDFAIGKETKRIVFPLILLRVLMFDLYERKSISLPD